MKKKIQILIVLIAILTNACKKEVLNAPANKQDNISSIGCGTCPSHFFDFDSTTDTVEICDDFTSAEWTSGSFNEGDVIGFSENGLYPVTLGTGASGSVNDFENGIYVIGPVLFEYGAGTQQVTFEIYGFYSQFNQMGFAVNGSDTLYMNETFPLTLDGVTIQLDTTIADSPGWTNSLLTFTGNISNIILEGFESGLLNMCTRKTMSTTTFDNNGPVTFTDFTNHAGVTFNSGPSSKTPQGYFGPNSTSLKVNFDEFIAYSPTKIGFVYARKAPNVNDRINIQLPGTDLIITTVDALANSLSPFGYEVEVFQNTNGKIWDNEVTQPTTGAIVDSILIKGNNMNEIIIGADLTNGELRNICTYYEQ